MIDMSEFFDDPMFAQKVPLIKRLIMKDSSGDQTTDYQSPVDIIAIVQPTGADDLLLLGDGERELPSKRIFSKESLNMGDLIAYQGKKWRIASLSNWSEYGFYDAIGVFHEGTQKPTKEGFKLS